MHASLTEQETMSVPPCLVWDLVTDLEDTGCWVLGTLGPLI